MNLIHRCGWTGTTLELKVEEFVYSGIKTITYACPKCDEDMSWIFEPDENYLNFIESQEVEKVPECPVKSSNRKNTKPILKVKEKKDSPYEH